MKNYKLYISVFMVALLATGCKKFLSITPKQKFSETQAITSLDALTKLTVGAYNQLQSANLYSGGLIVNSEYMADWVETAPLSDFSQSQFRTKTLNSYNGLTGGTWSDAYRAINQCNIVLDNLSKFESQNPALAATTKGECLFIRAAMHYELVRCFAQPSGFTSDDSHLGIPLRLSAGSENTGQNTKRSTVSECYAQIVADLTAAEGLLTNAASPYRASKASAQAFLAKAYFSQNKYTDAKVWCDKVISSSYTLEDSINTNFGKFENYAFKEWIFSIASIYATDANDPVLYNNFSYIPFGTTIPKFQMYGGLIPLILNENAVGGLRGRLCFKNFGNYRWTTKYASAKANVGIVRLAEMLLTRAECNAQLGASDADVRADYNLVRKRAGLLLDNTSAGKTALLLAIHQERDLELAMEGDHYHEVKRRKGTFSASTGTFAWNEPRLVYPIPQGEVDNNKNMVQNPGY